MTELTHQKVFTLEYFDSVTGESLGSGNYCNATKVIDSIDVMEDLQLNGYYPGIKPNDGNFTVVISQAAAK